MRTLKISKTSWLIIAAGIFIVIIAGLFLTRSQQIQEQDRLDDELGIAEMRLDKLQIKKLQQQEEELQRQLDESKVQLLVSRQPGSLEKTPGSYQVSPADASVLRPPCPGHRHPKSSFNRLADSNRAGPLSGESNLQKQGQRKSAGLYS